MGGTAFQTVIPAIAQLVTRGTNARLTIPANASMVVIASQIAIYAIVRQAMKETNVRLITHAGA
jgi:hypothetical protein